MKTTALLATLLISSFAAAAQPAREEFLRTCQEQLPAAQVELSPSPAELVYDFGSNMTEKAPDRLSDLSSTLHVKVGARPLMLKDASGLRACAKVALSASVSLSPMTIQVDERINEGGCLYSALLKRELDKASRLQELLESIADDTALKLKAQLAEVVMTGTPDEVRKALSSYVETEVKPYLRVSFKPVEEALASQELPLPDDSRCAREEAIALLHPVKGQ